MTATWRRFKTTGPRSKSQNQLQTFCLAPSFYLRRLTNSGKRQICCEKWRENVTSSSHSILTSIPNLRGRNGDISSISEGKQEALEHFGRYALLLNFLVHVVHESWRPFNLDFALIVITYPSSPKYLSRSQSSSPGRRTWMLQFAQVLRCCVCEMANQ